MQNNYKQDKNNDLVNQEKLTCLFTTKNFEVYSMLGYDKYYQRLSEDAYRIGKKLGIKNIDPEKIDEYYKLLEKIK